MSNSGLTNRASGASAIPEPARVTVILPCRDEAAAIADCIAEAEAGMRAAGLIGEVLVVDNGSTDGSGELASEAGARVVHEPTAGYGSALRRGIAEATGNVIVIADADHTYDLTRLGTLTAPILEGSADLVVGSRLHGLNRGTMPLLHRLIGTPAISFALRRVCRGLRVRDSQSGYRALDAEKVRALHLQATGMEFASEMLIRAWHGGMRIREISLGYRRRVGRSKLSSIADGWRHLQVILMLVPELVVFWPSLALLGLGLILSLLSLLNPLGFGLGPLRWQPVFIAPILIVLGAMGTVSGAVIARHSPLSGPRAAARFAAIGSARFSGTCITVGAGTFLIGSGLDLGLFAIWVTEGTSPSHALALAGLAQALVITGLGLAGFGVVYRTLRDQGAYRSHLACPEDARCREYSTVLDDLFEDEPAPLIVEAIPPVPRIP